MWGQNYSIRLELYEYKAQYILAKCTSSDSFDKALFNKFADGCWSSIVYWLLNIINKYTNIKKLIQKQILAKNNWRALIKKYEFLNKEVYGNGGRLDFPVFAEDRSTFQRKSSLLVIFLIKVARCTTRWNEKQFSSYYCSFDGIVDLLIRSK